jgi:hypothetical protein
MVVLVFASVSLAPSRSPAQSAGPAPAGAARENGSAGGGRSPSPQDVLSARSKVAQDFSAGRIDDAMAETERAIGLAQAAQGKFHPDVAFLKAVLAHFRESRGDYAAARDLLREAQEILERDTMRTNEMESIVRSHLAHLERLAAQDEMARRRLLGWVGSTALVVTRQPIGSAFCVDRRGLFVTTADLAADLAPATVTEFVRQEARILGTRVRPAEGEVPLALRVRTPSGLGPQLPARVIRIDRAHNFALLAVKTDGPLHPLEIAPAPPVRGATVTALTELVVGIEDSRSTRHPVPLRFTLPRPFKVETVRVRGGKCWLITLEETPAAGPPGWPVLDGGGRILGVLFNGLPGTGVHYVLPADVLAEFLGPAKLVFDPPVVPYRRRREPTSWGVRAWGRRPLPAGATLEVTVGEGPARRRFVAERSGDEVFTARVLPVPADAADAVDLVRAGPHPSARRTVADGEISVGSRRLRLSDVRLLRPGESPAGYDADGHPLFGPVAGLEAIRSLQPRSEGDAGPAEAGGLRMEFPPEDPAPIACEAVLRDGERVLDRAGFLLRFRDPPTDVRGVIPGSGPHGSSAAISVNPRAAPRTGRCRSQMQGAGRSRARQVICVSWPSQSFS